MSLIRSADKIIEYNKAYPNLRDEHILPYVDDAEQTYMKMIIGKKLFSALNSYLDQDVQDDQPYNDLLPYVIKPLSRFALYLASPSLDINVGATGFTTSGGGQEGMVAASSQRVDKYDKSLLKLAWENVETLLEFLEDNKDDYTLWTQSDAYTQATRNFVNTAAEFDSFVDMNIPRIIFQRIRPAMDAVEMIYIVPKISEELADEIKSQMDDDSVSAENELILKHIKRAQALYSIAEVTADSFGDIKSLIEASLNDEKRKTYRQRAEHHMNKVTEILYAAPDDYPLWKESDLYDDEYVADFYEPESEDKIIGLGAIPK